MNKDFQLVLVRIYAGLGILKPLRLIRIPKPKVEIPNNNE
jgi:hypothetical protein